MVIEITKKVEPPKTFSWKEISVRPGIYYAKDTNGYFLVTHDYIVLFFGNSVIQRASHALWSYHQFIEFEGTVSITQ